ncbi:MFS transporter [Mycolicibacterium xanthum]|uniref:MFS transporter n=1 Tax=Mycolicibacterium xanthum TaxID=2796469 RepID=UPI0027DF4AB7|nr:MFS transporter [Mycolicibacterium xanthum]
MRDANDTASAPVGDEERRRVQKRTLTVVVASQILGGAGLAAGIAVGALLAEDLLGTDSLSGVPTALFTLGAATAAFLIGRLTQRWGRRLGLGLGFAAGGVGAIGVVIAAATDNAPLLFVSLFVYGAGTATNLQARYAGTDLADPSRRGTAISVALVATTFGAVAGPNLITPLGSLATALGLPVLSGPFLLAAVAYLAAGIVLMMLLRPDPYLLARRIADEMSTRASGGEPVAVPPPGKGAYLGAAVMVVTQIAMIAIMTMTPVHMRAHHHDLAAVGFVIGAHVAAMYLPSPITGILVDRIGRAAMTVASGVTLLAAGLVAALSPGSSLPYLTLALVLLGLGWNFGLIAGTALVVDATVPDNRPRTQGVIDVGIALSGAAGGGMSGVVMATAGYPVLSSAGGLLALLLVPALLLTHRPAGVRAKV